MPNGRQWNWPRSSFAKSLAMGMAFMLLWGTPPSSRAQAIDDQAQLDFREQRAALPDAEIPARFGLAARAIDLGLHEQADELYREILAIDPADEQAFDLLLALAAERAIPEDSESMRLARESLPAHFSEFQSKRFIVISDASPSLAQSQLALLERTHHQLHRFAGQLQLRPLPLRNKLVCVLFANERDYRDFGDKHDGIADARVTGYYSPRHDWIVFYSAETNPQVVEARRRLEEFKVDVAEMNEQVNQAVRQGEREQAETLRHALLQTEHHLARQRQHIDDYARRETMVTTVHEAVHQLLFHTGVQSRSIRYPLWVCEGLATCFETQAPNKPFGPDQDYGPRREHFQKLLRDNALLPLHQLVVLESTSSEAEADVVYQQSYALVKWMSRFRKQQLRQYLMVMLQQQSGTLQPTEHFQVFEEAFGDAEALERNWLRHERRLLSQSQAQLQPD